MRMKMNLNFNLEPVPPDQKLKALWVKGYFPAKGGAEETLRLTLGRFEKATGRWRIVDGGSYGEVEVLAWANL